MVIECPSCKTKFKLPDEKVGPSGVSVRCSKCATTFAVRPPASAAAPAAPPQPVPQPAAPPVAPPATPTQPSANPFGPPPGQPSADPFAGMAVDKTIVSAPPFAPPATPTQPSANPFASPPSPGVPTPAAPPPGFGGMSPAFAAGIAATSTSAPAPIAGGFGTPFVGTPGATAGALPPIPPAMPASSAPVDDPNTLADESEASADTQAPFDPNMRSQLFGSSEASALGEEGDTGISPPPPGQGAPALTGGGVNFDFGSDPFAAASSPLPSAAPAPPPAELFAREPAKPAAPPPSPASAPSIDIAGPPAGAAARAQKKPAKKPAPKLTTARMLVPQEPVRAFRLLLALFFAGAAVSAFASLTEGTLDPRRIDRGRLSLLIGPPPVAENLAGLAITARRGGYVTTPPGKPRVYMAQGVAINAGDAPKGFIEVRGRMLADDGGVLAETTAPCGNSFRDDQLLGFRSGDELKRSYLPAGDGSSNAKLAPGSAVACTVVFFEAPAPEKTARFELEIVAAQPVS